MTANYMRHLQAFVLSEGDKYQSLDLASTDMHPQKAPGSPESGLDGWSYMMRTANKDFALLYFENKALTPELAGFNRNASYQLLWFHPVTGEWHHPINIKSDRKGVLKMQKFPDGERTAVTDWAAKIVEVR